MEKAEPLLGHGHTGSLFISIAYGNAIKHSMKPLISTLSRKIGGQILSVI